MRVDWHLVPTEKQDDAALVGLPFLEAAHLAARLATAAG
jgi:hypothetical protein